MKISLKNIVIDTDQIAHIQFDIFDNCQIVFVNNPEYHTVEHEADRKLLREIFFQGGLPDVVLPVEAIQSRLELLTSLAETKRALTAYNYRIQLVEEREQLEVMKSMVDEIEKIGVKEYRKKMQDDFAREQVVQSRIENISGYNKLRQ